MGNVYTDDLKAQIIKECREVGNVALVARRHEISKNTIYTWLQKVRKNGSVKTLSRNNKKKNEELKKRLKEVSTENDLLKKLMAEKELELSILRELRDQAENPL